MSALSHILDADPEESAASSNTPDRKPIDPMPVKNAVDDQAGEVSGGDGPQGDDPVSPGEPVYTSTTTSTRRNASGSVSSVYSGNKIRHLKKEDGIPLWRKDIQYDFLYKVFYDETKCFTRYSDGSKDHTFAEVYIDAMAKSSKCSKILKEKLLQDTEGAICMAMVCLLVNVGRMNTTLNFFPEMRAQLRTYHSIPALQAQQDPNAYKQLQDAPRLKSILKGATEDEPQPSNIEEIKAAKKPRTNPVNLIFVMSQYAPKVSEVHFQPPRDFFDLVMRGSLSSDSRARAFLWLVWWYLESDFTEADAKRNPFRAAAHEEHDQEGSALKVPPLESLTEEQAAAENVDTDLEIEYGETKRKERIAILASEPSPAMTALKRARKEKGLTSGGQGLQSDDEASEQGWSRSNVNPLARSAALNNDTASDYTRSPSPAASRGFHAVNTKPDDMRINNLLNNDDAAMEPSPPHGGAGATTGQGKAKGPGRGNWRRKKQDNTVPLTVRPQDDRAHHVPLLPNTGQLNFVNEAPQQLQPATPTGYHSFAANPHQGNSYNPLNPDHVPTPSYQAQKRHRGVTQHQSALINHRKQQIDYSLDRRLRQVHKHARHVRRNEGSISRAWKRIRLMPTDYDSEEERIKARKARDRADKDDDWRIRGKENVDEYEDLESMRLPRVQMAGLVNLPQEVNDVGEECKSLATTFRRCERRLERWQDTDNPGHAMIRRRLRRSQDASHSFSHRRSAPRKQLSMDQDGMEVVQHGDGRSSGHRAYSGSARVSEHRGRDDRGMVEPDDEDGGGELDEEDRELLGEVDADESEEDDEDEDMDDD